jgi:hypothetical protein
MKKQFVTYPITLALKELGFNDFHRFGWYIIEDGTEFGKSLHVSGDEAFYFNPEYCIKAPLWQQVIDWFRTEHGIWITVTFGSRSGDNTFGYFGCQIHSATKGLLHKINWYQDVPADNLSPKEAYEAAILEAIEIVKENKK